MAGHNAPAADGAEPKKKGKKLLLVLPVLALVGGGAAAYFLGLIPGLGPATPAHADDGSGADGHAAADGAGGHAPTEEATLPPGHFFELPEILVNLQSGGRQASYLKLRIALELPSSKDQAAVEKAMPRVIDQFQTFLRELRVSDLQGSAGIYRLRQELLTRVSAAVAPTEVRDVLFREILVN